MAVRSASALLRVTPESCSNDSLPPSPFGARISEVIVIHTYQAFEKARLLSPHAIQKAGWDGLMEILNRGGYVRYDFKAMTVLIVTISCKKGFSYLFQHNKCDTM